MEALFGKGKTPAQRLKEYQRSIKKSVREMDREKNALERNEKKLMADIKKEAKEGRVDSARIMAKDLVRTRGYIKKMYKMKSHMEAVSLRLATMQSSAQMAQSMKGVTKVMGKMNAKMNLPQISKIMMEFEKQNEMMGMKARAPRARARAPRARAHALPRHALWLCVRARTRKARAATYVHVPPPRGH